MTFSTAEMLKAKLKELAVPSQWEPWMGHSQLGLSCSKLASGLSHIQQVWKLKYKTGLEKRLLWITFLSLIYFSMFLSVKCFTTLEISATTGLPEIVYTLHAVYMCVHRTANLKINDWWNTCLLHKDNEM